MVEDCKETYGCKGEGMCQGAIQMRSNADYAKNPAITPPTTREGLTFTIENFRAMRSACLDKESFDLALTYATNILKTYFPESNQT